MSIHDLIPFYVLGVTTLEEKMLVEKYLIRHPSLTTEVSELATLVSLLAYSVDPIDPPPLRVVEIQR